MAANPSTSELNPKDERIHDECSERSWRGHHFRYRLAAGFCSLGDTVLDAACGSAYGAALLGSVDYVGVDNDLSGADQVTPGLLVEADLVDWLPDFDFDVFVGFETIEHLPEYRRYIKTAKQARKWIVVSAPVVPTTHLNPWHLHNFAPGELASLFIDKDWSLFQSVLQPSELSEIYVFERQ